MEEELAKLNSLSKDELVQKALDTRDKQSEEIKTLIEQWQAKVQAVNELQKNIGFLQGEFQKGLGIIGGIEISIKAFMEKAPQKVEEKKPAKKAKKGAK